VSAEDRYRSWLRKRRSPDVSADFADRVMQRVRAVEVLDAPKIGRAQRLLDWFGVHPFARAAAVWLAVAAAMVQGALLVRVGLG
jgi:hypothetical protein